MSMPAFMGCLIVLEHVSCEATRYARWDMAGGHGETGQTNLPIILIIPKYINLIFLDYTNIFSIKPHMV